MRVVTIDVFLLALYKRLFDYRLVVTFEGTDLTLARRSRLARIRVRFAVRHADAVAVVSRQLADALDSYVGRGRAVCIPNAVDIARAQTAAAHGSAAVAPDHFVFCGRLHPVKRVPLLVDIFKQCVDLGCDRNLYIVGDGEDREAVARRIAHYRLEDRVVLTGAMRHGEALAAVARARCLLLASSDEGSPIAVLEAMALGVPVIAPRVGGLPDLVRHGETGYLFPPDDGARAREHILCVGRSPEHARALGERGRAVARDRFSPDAMVGRYVALYRQACDRRHEPPRS
jgi:L-malate glycosyltransferase